MAEHESFDALQVEKLKPNEQEQEEDEEGDEDEDEDEEGKRLGEIQLGELQNSAPESRETQLETLAVPSTLELSENDQCAGFQVNSTSQSIDGAQLQEQLGVSHREILAIVTHQDAQMQTQSPVQLAVYPTPLSELSPTSVTQSIQTQTQSPLQLTVYPTPLSELSPTSVTQSISSAPSPILLEQKLPSEKVNTLCTPEVDKQNSSDNKFISSIPLVKTSASDGYNWRKYGQKQVKSPQGSRSYYRCTYSECYAKKIECCDHSGYVTEIVYKSQHTHEPPRKSNCTKESKLALSAECVRNSITEHPCRTVNDSELSTSSKERIQETPSIPERKRQSPNDSDGNGDVKIKEEHGDGDEPEPKRRVKKSNLEYSTSLLKPGKKPKFVVHAAGDVGISGDGYRWRKYGQKMVKGNPHPRNYYRCTSAGCPVRKHIETAIDNTSAVIITYKGIHDHDMPVPKKRHGPPSAPLVAAAAPASMNNLHIKKTDTHQNQISSTQWSVDTGGELTGEALDLGGEKAMESARTLLSIGFEIKPC
ncbi:probable WRKY transcription factor 32 isoform X1 [Prunus avium]|uniref:Probable WRKY transcription factor 32 isoform X1 n=1 Tax=Prunus avium TaxID=42229 RepID=A0A6P5SAS9_PRUAV|nr:probable WRKY transcription factor 32 isoform X1 [Prunus avium]